MENERTRGYTDYLVGGFGLVVLVLISFYLGGLWIGMFCTVALAIEGWTLINKYKEDTISEAIWRLSARPMIPFCFGVLDGLAVLHVLTRPDIDPKQVALLMALQFLLGHFFFQAKQEEKKQIAETIASNIGKVAEHPSQTSVTDQTGKVEVVRKAMGLNK